MRALVAALLFCGACATNSPPPDPPPLQTPLIQVTADDLMHDYIVNAADADAKYKGKIVQVQSTINGIGHDASGNEYLFLAAGDAGRAIQAYLAPNMGASLQKGEQVTVKGRVEGRVQVNVVLRGVTVGQ